MDGKCLVIGAGELTVKAISVEEGDYVIAVDGGLEYCGSLGIEPDLMIGDFDSVGGKEAAEIAEAKRRESEKIICLPAEKDDTDMLAALKEGLRRGYTDFRIFAGTGGRLDHIIANIQCLLYLKNRGAVGYLIDRAGMMLIIKNETVYFSEHMGGYLSLFSLVKESRGVMIKGMKYTLSNAVLHNDYPVGISNEFVGEAAAVAVDDGELLCILQYVM